MKFKFGNINYGDDLVNGRSVNQPFLNDCTTKFSANYWGIASTEQWKQNKATLVAEEGEIRGEYKSETGIILHLIYLKGRKRTIICTQKDLDNGYYEHVMQALSPISVRKKKANLTIEDIF